MTQCHMLGDPNLSVYCHGNLTCYRGKWESSDSLCGQSESLVKLAITIQSCLHYR